MFCEISRLLIRLFRLLIRRVNSASVIPACAAFFFIFSLSTLPTASASSFYWDIGGGVAKMNQLGSFYGSTTDTSTALGFNINSSLFVNFSNGAPIDFSSACFKSWHREPDRRAELPTVCLQSTPPCASR